MPRQVLKAPDRAADLIDITNQARRKSIPYLLRAIKGGTMKIHIKFPGGGTLDFEKGSMTDKQLYAICYLIGTLALLIVVFHLITSVCQ